MRRRIEVISLVLLALRPTVAATVTPQKPVQQRVAAVLDAYSRIVHEGETEATARALESALSPILNDRSEIGSETLAVLLGFYVGEHPGEDISCELVARGRPILKYLRKYESARVVVPGVTSDALKSVKTEYPIVVKRIEAGDICAREP
jgi:hypothetical protein